MKLFRKIGIYWEKLQALYCRYLGRDYMCGCGHTAKWKTVLNIHGHKDVFRAPSKTPGYCSECWAKAIIQCARCSKAILPGDPVTLDSPGESSGGLFFFSSEELSEVQKRWEKKDFVVPEYAVMYQQEPHLKLVCCLRRGCVKNALDQAGFWVMPGKVRRTISPFEELIAHGGDEVIIVNRYH